jgi:hypothetical protein
MPRCRIFSTHREQHEVGVKALDRVPRVRIVPWLGALSPDESQGLVLALPGHGAIRDDDHEAAPNPVAVVLDGLRRQRVQMSRHFVHEVSTGGDAVRVKHPQDILNGRHSVTLLLQSFPNLQPLPPGLLSVDSLGEPTLALLGHLCARRHAIHGEVEQLLGAHASHGLLDVFEKGQHECVKVQPPVLDRFMHGRVDHTVQIKVCVYTRGAALSVVLAVVTVYRRRRWQFDGGPPPPAARAPKAHKNDNTV